MTRQVFAFVAAGALAAAVNWLSRVLFSHYVSLEVAVTLAYAVGMTTAYLLTRLFVFDPSGRSKPEEYGRFFLVNLVALGQVVLVTSLLDRIVFPGVGFHWHAESVAHAIGITSPIVTSYFGHRYYTFARKANG